MGGRVERNGSYGTHAVPRAALAVRLRDGEDATTLRASAGMGIKEPSFLESYGESFFAKGNPDLDPERSTTFDLGVEQRLFGSRLRASVTAFHHDYRDQIAYTVVDFDTFEGTYVNLAQHPGAGRRGRARGAADRRRCSSSASTRTSTARSSRARATSTRSTPSASRCCAGPGTRARSRPSCRSRAGARGRRSCGWASGPTATSSASASRGTTAYTRLDARLRVRVAGPVEAFVVGENLLDAEYQEVLGYPALGRSVRGGLRLAVGGRP